MQNAQLSTFIIHHLQAADSVLPLCTLSSAVGEPERRLALD